HVTPPGTWHVPGGGLTDDHSTTIIRRRSAVAQLRALVEQLRAGADERGIGVAADRGQREGSHAVAVLEGQLDAEVALETAADGVGGQRAQQLAAGLLV